MKDFETKTGNTHGNDGYGSWGRHSLVPYEVLDAAIAGDRAAIYEIVKHFGGHIVKAMTAEKLKTNGKFRRMAGRKDMEPDDEDCIEVAKIALIQSFPVFRKKY